MKRVLGHRCGTSVVLALAQRPQVRCNHPQLHWYSRSAANDKPAARERVNGIC